MKHIKKIITIVIISLTLTSALFAEMSLAAKNALKEAMNGNPVEQAYIGILYFKGREGCIRSYEKAYSWLLKSVKNGMRSEIVLSHLALCIMASESFKSYLPEFYILAHEAAVGGDSLAVDVLKGLELFTPNYQKNPEGLRKVINSLPSTINSRL